jgi:hypothetical protein
MQHGQVVVGQRRPVLVLGEQLGDLGDGERQVSGAQLGQLAADQQPVQWQGRVGPGRQHQPQL